jgi:hypothetical protein
LCRGAKSAYGWSAEQVWSMIGRAGTGLLFLAPLWAPCQLLHAQFQASSQTRKAQADLRNRIIRDSPIGALCGGMPPALVSSNGTTSIKGYRAVVIAYAVLDMVLAPVFARLSLATEVGESEDPSSNLAAEKTLLGIGRSRKIALKLRDTRTPIDPK